MKLQFFSLLSLSALASARFLASTESTDGTLQIGFNVTGGFEPHGHGERLRKRDGTLEVPVNNMYTYYSVELELGTPPQKSKVIVNTGSSDLWVISKNNPYCATTAAQLSSGGNFINCSSSGTFAAGDSSTYQFNNSDFDIIYESNTIAQGDWGMDTLTFNGQEIPNMSFGLGNTTNSSMGVFGIGYTDNEATMALSKPYTYANFPVRLAQAGIINTPAYSLWLNDINAKEGNILFGGIDHAKYSGDLISVPVLKDSKSATKPTSFTIALNSLRFNSNNSSQEFLPNTIGAVLSSGTSLSLFPEKVAANLLAAFNASYSFEFKAYTRSCDVKGSLDYSFNGANISVPFSSLLLPIVSRGGQMYFEDSSSVCMVGILPANYNFALLGDTFLRSAYVVYDLQNDEIALAQANPNTTDSNIEAIVSTIPSATRASLYFATSGIGSIGSTESSNAASAIITKPSSSVSALLLVVVFLSSFCLVLV